MQHPAIKIQVIEMLWIGEELSIGYLPKVACA